MPKKEKAISDWKTYQKRVSKNKKTFSEWATGRYGEKAGKKLVMERKIEGDVWKIKRSPQGKKTQAKAKAKPKVAKKAPTRAQVLEANRRARKRLGIKK